MDRGSLLVRSRTSMTSQSQKRVLMFAVALMMSTLCACTAIEDSTTRATTTAAALSEPTAPSEHAGAQLGTISDAKSEFLATAASLAPTLPEGVAFPESMPGNWDSTGQFEAGFGEMQAALYWQCAWLSSYVRASSQDDAVGTRLAIDKLGAWAQLDVVTAHVDADSLAVWQAHFLEPARSGDDDLIREMASSCG